MTINSNRNLRQRVQPLVRATAWSHATARTAIGIGTLASPSVADTWVGSTGTGSATVLRPAFAVRDAVLGVGALWALATGKPIRHWFVIGTAIEVVELTAIARNRSELPPTPTNKAWSMATAAGLFGGALVAALLDEHS
ncbi:hypothetical protein ACWELJ_08985 [Nocardia sp. NPDC004582]